MATEADLVGTAESAAIMEIERSTISRWVERGFLTPALQLPGVNGAMLFHRADIEALRDRIEESGFPRRERAS